MQVLYADGDSESIFLPMERMRVNVSAGEILTAPTPDELTATAQHLLSAADADDAKAMSGEAVSCPHWPLQVRLYHSEGSTSVKESACAPEKSDDGYCLHR